MPEIWQRDIYNLGRERLQELIKKDLGLEKQLIQLVSEPIAAASYYAWEMQRRAQEKNTNPFQGNLLVCDMGGGTFDVSLCRIYSNNKIEVLYFDGEGDKGLESAGVAFDKNIVQIAYQKQFGEQIQENDSKFIRLLREFENVKIDLSKQIIFHSNSEFKINNTEKTILEKMINNPGKVFEREEIGRLIDLDKERSIDVIITRLRKKIEIDPKNPKFLQTIRGAGYVLWIE